MHISKITVKRQLDSLSATQHQQTNCYCFMLVISMKMCISKVPYYEKHVFSGVYIYKLVLPEPTNSQNMEGKQVLHGLCSPPTCKTGLLQAVQIELLSLHNERRDVHRLASSAIGDIREGGVHPRGEVQCVQR